MPLLQEKERTDLRSLNAEINCVVPALSPTQIQQGQRLMTQEGSLWSVMNAISAPVGIVITAFALQLKADLFVIGLLSALPLLAALVQIWTPQTITLMGSRKAVCVIALAIARLLLIPIVLLPLASWFLPQQNSLWLGLLIGLLGLSAAFTAIGGTAWLSWSCTVIPTHQRAAYFARRNTIMGFIGLFVALGSGYLLDWWIDPITKTTHAGAYTILFVVSAIFGVLTIFLLRTTPDLSRSSQAKQPHFMDSLRATWQSVGLRRYLIFRASWLFSMGLATPFYFVYMLENLKMSFTEVSLLQNIGGLAGLVTLPLWGKLITRYGCSRILFWTSLSKVVYVASWGFIAPNNAFLFLIALQVTLFVDSGLNLSSSNLLMNLMPSNAANNVGYFSVFIAITSLVGAIGPFLAGSMVSMVGRININLLGTGFNTLELMFLLSAVLRLASLAFFRDFEKTK